MESLILKKKKPNFENFFLKLLVCLILTLHILATSMFFFKHYCHLRIFQKSFLNCSFKVLIMSRSSLSFQSHFNNKGKHIIFPSPGEKWTKIKGIAWIWRHLCFKSQRNEKKKRIARKYMYWVKYIIMQILLINILQQNICMLVHVWANQCNLKI